jgi:pimeloyl-ACP methyl ester carboxylesterase
VTNGDLLAHRVEGEGEPLLLLNGGLMSYAAWQPVSARLRERHRLVLCDLRGQLLSPGPAPGDLAANVTDLTRLLEYLGIGSTHVLGTSYGGEIGLLLAALEPARVRSLVAVTVSDHATEEMKRGAAESRSILADPDTTAGRGRFHDRLVAEVYSEGFRQRFAAQLAARRAQVIAIPDAWFDSLDGIIAASEALDLRPHLSSIRSPTLIVIAAADQVMPAERSLALVAGIAGAETRIQETSGHALVAEDPAWLAEVSLDFLARHTRAAAADRSPT